MSNQTQTIIQVRDAEIDSIPEINLYKKDVLKVSTRNVRDIEVAISMLKNAISTLNKVEQLQYVQYSVEKNVIYNILLNLDKNKKEGTIEIWLKKNYNFWEGVETLPEIVDRLQSLLEYWESWYNYWNSSVSSCAKEPEKIEF
jgi:hypothetical protein